MRSIRELALAFDRACRAAGVPYALVGGLAVMAWGQPRATTGVDALARIEAPRIDRFVRALAAEGLRVAGDDLEDALKGEGHATIFDSASSFHVDLKAARSAAEMDEVESAQEVRFEEGRLRVATAEHTVAFKLVFGSERDLQDARSIVARLGPDLDRAKLKRLAATLRVSRKLAKLLKEASAREPGAAKL